MRSLQILTAFVISLSALQAMATEPKATVCDLTLITPVLRNSIAATLNISPARMRNFEIRKIELQDMDYDDKGNEITKNLVKFGFKRERDSYNSYNVKVEFHSVQDANNNVHCYINSLEHLAILD